MLRHSAIKYPNTFWGHFFFFFLKHESLNLGILSDLLIDIKGNWQIHFFCNLSYYNLSLNESYSNIVPIHCEL